MKTIKLLSLIVPLFVVLTCNAQLEKPPLNSKWVYNHVNLGVKSEVHLVYSRDTLIHSQVSMLLAKQKLVLEPFDTTYFFKASPEIFHQNDSVVYWLNEFGQFDTLYNFKAKVGDSWRVRRIQLGDTVSQIIQLDSHKIEDINGFRLKVLFLCYYGHQVGRQYKFRDKVYEKIGGIDQYLNPWDKIDGMLDGHEGGSLRCYTDSFINYVTPYWQDRGLPCETKLGMSDLQNRIKVKIYPNPNKGDVKIICAPGTKLEIFNSVGQLEHSETFKFGENSIQLPGLKSGMHNVKVLDVNDLPIGNYKIVVAGR